MKKDEKRVNTDGGEDLSLNPFAELDGLALPSKPDKLAPKTTPKKPAKALQRVELRREKKGRGGKTVTTIAGLERVGAPRRQAILHKLKTTCACGGSDDAGVLILQGDVREKAASLLTEEGCKPVLAGG